MVKKTINFIATIPIYGYRWIIRPWLPKGQCVFEVSGLSCSEYSLQAIHKYGPLKGGFLGIRRILRCHPWQKNHYDPLP